MFAILGAGRLNDLLKEFNVRVGQNLCAESRELLVYFAQSREIVTQVLGRIDLAEDFLLILRPLVLGVRTAMCYSVAGTSSPERRSS